MALERKKEDEERETPSSMVNRVYTCKTCNRRFSSFQALGGHRASHSKPTGRDSHESVEKSKTHECRICGKKFVLGQALGGHMRKHRSAVEEEEKILRQSSMCNTPSAVANGVKILLLPEEKLAPTEIVPSVSGQPFDDRTNWESVQETPTVTHNFFPGEEVMDIKTPPQRESTPDLKRFNSSKSISCLDLDLKLKPSWVDD